MYIKPGTGLIKKLYFCKMGKPKITKKKLKDYLQDSKNFNKGNEYGESLIAKSISKFGAGRSMLAASDGTLIAGNKSHKKLAEAGIENVIEVETDGKTAVVVKRTDIKSGSKQFHEMALADNASALKNITFDEVLLEETLSEEVLIEWGVNNPKAEEDDYEAPPLEEIKTDIKAGDVFEIGNHRLMCGDCTSSQDVEKLMNGYNADIVTDPPYGIGFKYNLHDDSSNEENESIVRKAFSNSKVGGKIWTPGLMNLARELKNYPKAKVLVWHKGFAQAGNGLGGASTWEPILVIDIKGGRLPNDYLHYGTDRVKELTGKHPCPKPVLLYSHLIESLTGKAIYDPFLGSGTTMVAASQLNRKCYGMEIDPKYCQIILDRMLKLDSTLRITKNGKAYKRCDIGASPNGTHKPSAKGTSRNVAKETAQQV